MKPLGMCACFATVALCLAQSLAPKESEQQLGSLKNAKQLSMAMMMYCGDNDDRTPYLQSTMSLYAILRPYLSSLGVAVTPRPGSKYEYNKNFGGIALERLDDPAMTPWLHEAKPYSDASHVVAYADTHCKVVKLAYWSKTTQALAKKHPRPYGVKPLPKNWMVSDLPNEWRDRIARGGSTK